MHPGDPLDDVLQTLVTDRLEMERLGMRAFFASIGEHRALYQIMREAEFVDPDVYAWHYETLGAAYQRGIERAIAEEPDNLRYGTDYRQVVIALGAEFAVGGVDNLRALSRQVASNSTYALRALVSAGLALGLHAQLLALARVALLLLG